MSKINLIHLISVVFIISWIGVVPGLLSAHGYTVPAGLKGLNILMTLGPLMGGVYFIYRSYGFAGLGRFFKKILLLKTSGIVFTIAILVPVIATFAAPWIGFGLSGEVWPENYTPGTILQNGVLIFAMYLFINTEELVWRGIVFEKLLSKYSFIESCIRLIPIWWLFHLPLFLYPGGHQAGYGIPVFTCIVIAETFILGWIYVMSKRSLFYIHVHHQLLNGFGQAFPLFPIFIAGNQLPIRIFAILLLVVAGLLMLRRKGKLSNETRV